jgi:hypothetical protein
MRAATAMPGEAAMLTAAAMSGEAAMLTGSWVPVPKAVAPPTMIPVVLMIPVVITPATDPAVAVYVIAITRRSVTNGLRASGQAKTDADQQQQYHSRPNSAAIHRYPHIRSYTST